MPNGGMRLGRLSDVSAQTKREVKELSFGEKSMKLDITANLHQVKANSQCSFPKQKQSTR
jgi:hypothetical protein